MNILYTYFIEDNSKDLAKYFQFHRQPMAPGQQQYFFFLKNKYEIRFHSGGGSKNIFLRDKGSAIDQASRVGNLEHAKELVKKLSEEIKQQVENEFGIQIR